MALQITTELTTQEGFQIANAYGRVAVANQFKGDYLQGAVEIYKDEQSFLAGQQAIQFPDLLLGVQFDYVYEPNTVNILDLAHDAVILKLAEQNIVAVKML